jgi:pullulanase
MSCGSSAAKLSMHWGAADPTDISLYELHIRDFSASDETVPAHLRGKYLAFSSNATGILTDGQAHLQQLGECGLTHVHLLPSYDFGSVPELAANQHEPTVDLTQFAPGVLF